MRTPARVVAPTALTVAAVALAGCGGTAAPRRTVTKVVTPSRSSTPPARTASGQAPVAQAPASPGTVSAPVPSKRVVTSREATSCSEAPSSYRRLMHGDRGPDVAVMQCLLNRNGASIAVDGVWGDQTSIAYADVITRRLGESPQDPSIGVMEWQALVTTGSTPRLTTGSSGAAVRRLQRGLSLGLRSVAVDGRFGPQTLAAVRDYQAANGLVVDGVVGPQTWAALQSGRGAH